MDKLLLDAAMREKLNKFSTTIAVVITVFTLLAFWIGVDFMRESVYKNYFNPTRHVIIDQDQDSGEILPWKDALGHVYTPEDRDVRLFPYGIMFLLLLLMGVAAGAYKILVEHYAIILLMQERAPQAYLDRMALNKEGLPTC
ncbi:hypothetical protein PTH_2260 [Pelotomaculum thermopropionicum SI]|uniref:Uncharacterized protein n=1 Tax=Pelotomaculum thermopropionicum (strain DSM 13744 / JCM 10971 / SI) TaxID=370438 RepID=A5CZX8_PELTS|nr:hypothetical protein PTH_2260 [Pelotomaculum thermopropionicum SI]